MLCLPTHCFNSMLHKRTNAYLKLCILSGNDVKADGIPRKDFFSENFQFLIHDYHHSPSSKK